MTKTALIDGEVCACDQYAQVCGCYLHSTPKGAETAHGTLIHWRGAHWASHCALRQRVLEAEEQARAESAPPEQQTPEAAILDACVEMFRCWERWDWFSDPPARIEYWAQRDYLEKLVRAYRVSQGEEVHPFPLRELTETSSPFPARPAGITDPPPWRAGDHMQQIIDKVYGVRALTGEERPG